jgi:TolB-like protein
MSLFKELKRRNVFKVSIAYSVASWLLLQIVDLVLENINAPDWVMQVFMLGLAVGFPIAVILAWAFEITPDGVKLEKDVGPGQSIGTETGKQLNRGIIMIMSVAIVLLLTDRFRDEAFTEPEEIKVTTENTNEQENSSDVVQANKSIAVLPFRDMSSAQDQGYFGEGIAEELLNALVKVDGLHVASRTSAFSLVDENLDIPAIAQRLGVAHILEGSIRTSGQQVRVTAQLIEVNEDVHLWSETYDGSLDDIFKIQDEITSKIIRAMEIQLGGGTIEAASTELTDNAEAYQLYLKGRHFWRQRSSDSLQLAIELFKQAIDLDPGFHRAWSNLAFAYINLPFYDSNFDAAQYHQLGLQAGERALEINPQSSEALTVIANNFDLNCNVTKAARFYKKAIDTNPKDPTAHHWYAIILMNNGRLNLALEQIRIARELDPLISAVIAVEAEILMLQGLYEESGMLNRQAAELGIFQGSTYYVGMQKALQGEIQSARLLMSQGLNNVDEAQLKSIELFLNALEDPGKTQGFETYMAGMGSISSNETIMYGEMLALLGSPDLFDFSGDLSCGSNLSTGWSNQFRKQRGTVEFFNYMQQDGTLEYWREFGWPDDCASLDQTLAECD